jgi:hypothetical protein
MALHPTPDLLPPGTRLPPYARISNTSRERNTAAAVSLFCAMLWPASLLAWLLAPGLSMLLTGDQQPPELIPTLATVGITCAPFVGIVAGHVGFYRALKYPTLHASQKRALIGLVLGYVWLVALLLITGLGVALAYWLTHLGRG